MGDHQPLARYPVKTSAMYKLAVVIAALLAAVPVAMLAWLGSPPPGYTYIWIFYALALAAPVLIIHNAAAFRITGGAGEIRLFRDRVELPGDVRMPYATLKVREHRHVNRYVMFGFIPVGESTAARYLIFADDRRKHTFEARVFEHPDCVDAVRRDMDLIRNGRAPEGLAGLHKPNIGSQADVAQYEEQLDRELAEID